MCAFAARAFDEKVESIVDSRDGTNRVQAQQLLVRFALDEAEFAREIGAGFHRTHLL
jgi:hypothetical protein